MKRLSNQKKKNHQAYIYPSPSSFNLCTFPPSSQRASMATTTATAATALSFLLLLLLGTAVATRKSHTAPRRLGSLSWDYYKRTCPRLEEIIQEAVERRFRTDPAIAAGLIRLHFHDCFVYSCDASILLRHSWDADDSDVELASPANSYTIHGLDLIDEVKLKLNHECPWGVTCADLLAFAARDAAVLAGIPRYKVPSGRADGMYSRISDVAENLPAPFHNLTQLTKIFKKNGFKQSEMVVLSGAHSIGGAHCSSFDYRLYNSSIPGGHDPAIPEEEVQRLRRRCPEPKSRKPDSSGKSDPKVEFLPNGRAQFDAAAYYRAVLEGKGLLTSDQELLASPQARAVVERMMNNPKRWAKQFAKAMIKLGTTRVRSLNTGNIRRNCSSYR